MAAVDSIAGMARVNEQGSYDVAPDEMWQRIGDFHGFHEWHPAIASQDELEGGRVRALHLDGGGTVVETLLDEGERSYSYRIDESPLPVADYTATLAVLDGDSGVNDGVRWGSVILIVGGLLWFGARYAKWVTTNFVVTSDRVIFRVGVVAKKGMEIPLERINTVFFNQSIFERMIGCGDVAIESGGETGKETFSDIRKPAVVQHEIYRQMEANNTRMYAGRQGVGATAPAAPAAVADHLTVPQQIEKLDELRQRGVLTEAEFAEKKAELLRRM